MEHRASTPRVIQLIPYDFRQVGGIEVHVRQLCAALHSQLGDTRWVTATLAFRLAHRHWAMLEIPQCVAHSLASLTSTSLAGPLPRLSPFSVGRDDLLHIHGLARLPMLRLLSRVPTDVPVIFSPHGSFWSELAGAAGGVSAARRLVDRWFAPHFLSRCSALLVASDAERAVMDALTASSQHFVPLHVLPLPVSSGPTAAPAQPPHSDSRLLALGRQDRIKGFDLLATAVANNPDLPACDIVGPPGNATRMLERLISRAPEGRIALRPPIRSDFAKHALLTQAAVVVVPSYFESYSLVAREAIVAGSRLVMSEAAAASLPPSVAQTFRTGDAADLATQIRHVLRSPRSDTCVAARAHMLRDLPSYDDYAHSVLRVYQVATNASRT